MSKMVIEHSSKKIVNLNSPSPMLTHSFNQQVICVVSCLVITSIPLTTFRWTIALWKTDFKFNFHHLYNLGIYIFFAPKTFAILFKTLNYHTQCNMFLQLWSSSPFLSKLNKKEFLPKRRKKSRLGSNSSMFR